MSLLDARDLVKSHGAEIILSDVTFQVARGDKVGVVGANGSGKTTLLRLLLGLEEADSGEVARSRDASIGYLSQHHQVDPAKTVIEETLSAFQAVAELEHELRDLEHRMADGSEGAALDKLLARHGECSERFERAGGWALRPKAEEMLVGLGVMAEFFDRQVGTLSGGETGRVVLAKLLLSNADVLMLDEPTNHLDIDGCEWLEDFLARSDKTCLVVSHDRYFLDRVTEKTLEVDEGTARMWNGRYSHFELQKAEERKAAQRMFETQQDFIRKEREFIRKHMAGQRSREAKGRLKRLERLELFAAPSTDPESMNLRLTAKRRLGNDVVELTDVAMTFGDRVLFENLDLRIETGERFGIIGPNGAGKSTLLKLMLGELAPSSGVVKVGSTVEVGYYDQRHTGLDRELTPFETIAGVDLRRSEFEVRRYLARFLFFDEDVNRRAKTLSGGERGRLLLAKLLLQRPNVLILDEPTNHLDIPSSQALEEALSAFSGTIIAVSHDRYFIDKLCTRVLYVDGVSTKAHAGNYTFAHDARARTAAQRSAREATARTERAEDEARMKRQSENKRAPATTSRARSGQRTAEKVEADIIAREAEKSKLLWAMAEPAVYLDPAALKDHRTSLEAVEAALKALESEWERFM